MHKDHKNVELKDTGWAQARSLASKISQLSGPPVGAIFSSDLVRVSSLARLVGELVGIEPILDPALREVHIGQIAGLVREVALVQFPAKRHRTANPTFDFSDIGGESAQAVIDRHFGFLKPRVSELQAKGVCRIVLVGHGTALRLVFQYVLRLIPALHDQGHCQLVNWT